MHRKFDRTVLVRIVVIIALFPIGFIFPYALLLAFFLGWTLWDQYKNNGFFEEVSTYKPNDSFEKTPQRSWLNVKPEDKDWYDLFIAECESPAEEKFLSSMIREFDLKPDNGKLISPILTLEMQVELARYRFDFLVNGRQIIEIDGAAWHSSPEQVARDRIRDEFSVKHGYKVLRIPAKVVFNTPQEAIRRVKATLIDTPQYTAPKTINDDSPTQFTPKTISPLKLINSFSLALGAINEKASQAYQRAEAEKESKKNETLHKDLESSNCRPDVPLRRPNSAVEDVNEIILTEYMTRSSRIDKKPDS